MDKKSHINFWYFIATILVVMLFQQWWISARQVETIPYSQFQTMLRDGQIAEISITETNIRGRLKTPLSDGRAYIHTVRVDPDFAEELQKYGVQFTGKIESNFLGNILSWVIPAIVFLVFGSF